MNEYEKVKLLFDYTKFHIGIYTTLATIVIGAFNLHLFTVSEVPMWISIGFIAIAGLSGGIVASTLPECNTLDEFFRTRTGFWGIPLLSGRNWTRVEHTTFWIGVLSGLAAFARHG